MGEGDREDRRDSSSSRMMLRDFPPNESECDNSAILRARAVRPCRLIMVSRENTRDRTSFNERKS